MKLRERIINFLFPKPKQQRYEIICRLPTDAKPGHLLFCRVKAVCDYQLPGWTMICYAEGWTNYYKFMEENESDPKVVCYSDEEISMEVYALSGVSYA